MTGTLSELTFASLNHRSQPSVRKAGTYFVKVWHVKLATGAQFWRGTVSRQGSALGFVRITGAHASSAADVVSELRRNVRNARKAGGL